MLHISCEICNPQERNISIRSNDASLQLTLPSSSSVAGSPEPSLTTPAASKPSKRGEPMKRGVDGLNALSDVMLLQLFKRQPCTSHVCNCCCAQDHQAGTNLCCDSSDILLNNEAVCPSLPLT
jgi:hypothetical protein